MTPPNKELVEKVALGIARKAEEWREETGNGDWICSLHKVEREFIATAALEASPIGELVEALTPSADTKAAYIGEFSFKVEIAHPRLGSEFRSIDVPWTTIKEIMAAIRERALAKVTGGESGE